LVSSDQESAVADEGANTPGPFDVTTIKALVALMSRHDLSEIDLHEGDRRIRLRRGVTKVSMTPSPLMATPASVLSPVPAAPAPKADGAAPTAAAPSKPLLEIKSPTPGTFYAAPNPDSEPYVRVGSRVNPDTVVCLIEAMKLYNDIKAECSGIVTEILVENQQPVEYGQVLFRVDPMA
jgi:acetyl-CoA carboxylase biotin carboxyl carrier protein